MQNISHYYNNIFALHMHTFIVFTLILNTFFSIIHYNTRFIVIPYNHNLHFKIHVKKIPKIISQFISSYFDTIENSDNNLNIGFTTKVFIFLYYWKLNQNYNKIPCFAEMKSKQQIQSMVYQNKICGFLFQSTYNSFHYFCQNCVSKNVLFFSKSSFLGSPKYFHPDSKPTKIQNSN